MPKTRRPSDQSALARYLTGEAELTLMQDALYTELSRQQRAKQFVLFRGHVSAHGLIAALADALIEQEVHETHPGKADDPAPFT